MVVVGSDQPAVLVFQPALDIRSGKQIDDGGVAVLFVQVVEVQRELVQPFVPGAL